MTKFKRGDIVEFNAKLWNFKRKATTNARFRVKVLDPLAAADIFVGEVVEANEAADNTTNNLGATNRYITEFFEKTPLRDARGRFANKLTLDAQKYKELCREDDADKANAFLDEFKGSYAVKILVTSVFVK
jgi:hypothetical protein